MHLADKNAGRLLTTDGSDNRTRSGSSFAASTVWNFVSQSLAGTMVRSRLPPSARSTSCHAVFLSFDGGSGSKMLVITDTLPPLNGGCETVLTSSLG